MQNDLGHWTTTLEIPETFFGFIYRITNHLNQRIYLGKKQAQSSKKLKPLKGSKRGRRKLVETDWKTYTGSCRELNEDIEKHGKENFSFEILLFCTCKWELAHEEARLQFKNEVLCHDQYYNGIINLRIGKKPKSLR